ncbi:hypothetical protein [Hymenobacter glacieicola]|uniref:Uncharacterized protein n=1 Tax=Hymenobacter glacieicola TaxID=1562124 RepID=A0ABQ1WXB6_9BACT|nr:hypothetical protein [Hymenobacter glacieicola]GGG47720.1 hypothetical protein GCM10011378_24900 [Hymenobacter glacieicola]
MSASLPLKMTMVPVSPASRPRVSVRAYAADWLRVLHRVNPILSWSGWLHVGFLLMALVVLPFDNRVVTGLPVWVKPAKFAVSGLLYLWTLAWLLADLPAPAQRAVRRISWAVGVSMVAEMVCIVTQAARGTTSHFNGATPLDGMIFSVMGVMIVVNTVATIWALLLVWRHRPHGPAGYVWGVRLGLLLFLLGSLLGGMMIHLNQHTVGAPDGGPGLPGLGWSTRAGDLRIAHFLGLHSLQVVPLLGWVISRWLPRRAVLLTWLGAALYAALVALLFLQALQGTPLVQGRF